MIRTVIFCFAVLTLVTCVLGEIMNIRPCRETTQCEVKQVTASPCQLTGDVCKFKRGKNASITLDFKPQFSSEKLTAKAFWENGFIDLPFVGLDNNACLTTKCPVTKDLEQQYTYELLMSKAYPAGTYDVKWKLYNPDDDNQLCCAIFKIKILR